MKKILLILLLLCLCGCDKIGEEKVDPNQKYADIIENIQEHEEFLDSSDYYDISADIASIDGAYRFYVTIDNPRAAIYDIEVIAIEEGKDYSTTMAANVGIFEDIDYAMIPNQANPDKGYVKGLVISATTENPETTLYINVSFKNEDYSLTHSEYIKLDVKYGE